MGKTLRKKILLGYGIALALIVVVLILAVINLLSLGKASDAILTENYKSILAAEKMIGAIERQDSAILMLLSGFDDEGLKQYQENEHEFLQWLGRAKDNITVKGEAEIIVRIDKDYASYMNHFSSLRLLNQVDYQKAAAFYHGTDLPSFKLVRDACAHLREINQQTMFKASDSAKNVARRAIWSMVIIGIMAIGIGLGFSLLLSKLLVKPLNQIMDATQKITEGNYDVQISSVTSDELGHLATAFNAMVKKLKTYHDMNVEQIVAEQRKSDAIIRSIDDGIIVVESDFKVTGINPTAAGALKIESDILSQHKHFLEVINNEQLFDYVKQAIESGRSPKIAENENVISIKQGESQRHYQFSITPMHSKTGAMLGVVLVLRDVTKLKELDRLKSEFVMAASHELKTPLASMVLSIKLLQETIPKKLTEKEQQLFSVLHEELLRLKALVNDLLDLSRIEAGKMIMEFDKVSVALLFEKSIAVLKTGADEKSIELSFKITEGLPAVKADLNKITWILTNLISNALRYTPAGGYIGLLAERIGPQVHISVKDNGSGIPYEYQSKIFDKFVQVKDDKAAGGSGLGLAICKEIVRAHGGTIWVDSTPGQGSTFTFTLPVSDNI